ncbi:MAG: hypothetical protein ACOYK9_03695 [Chlamydiia bacterium]
MNRVWNRLRQLAFYPEEERIYVWILMGPLFLTLLLIPQLSKFAPLQLALVVGSISLSWMVAIFFGLESLEIYQKVRGFESQVEGIDREKERLEKMHQNEVEQLKNSITICYSEMDELNQNLLKEKESLTISQTENATFQETLGSLEEELAQLKERFRAVNSELKVYKSSSYTRYEVKHMVDELNRFRIREKQAALLKKEQVSI